MYVYLCIVNVGYILTITIIQFASKNNLSSLHNKSFRGLNQIIMDGFSQILLHDKKNWRRGGWQGEGGGWGEEEGKMANIFI